MSASTSPVHFNSLDGIDDTYRNDTIDVNFKVDIGQKMKVPTKISFNPDSNGQSVWMNENLNMEVPERILVAGQHQHIGTRAPPREIMLDNSLLPTEPYPGDPRVATPPRTLTLDKYPFPGVDEFEEPPKEVVVVKQKTKFTLNDPDTRIAHRESTPPIGTGGDGLTPAEEILHLRRQLAKLNRRVIALELENLNRLQKEKILYGLGIAYCLFKVLLWVNRN